MFNFIYNAKSKKGFGEILKKIYRNKYHHLYKGILTHSQKNKLADEEMNNDWDVDGNSHTFKG